MIFKLLQIIALVSTLSFCSLINENENTSLSGIVEDCLENLPQDEYHSINEAYRIYLNKVSVDDPDQQRVLRVVRKFVDSLFFKLSLKTSLYGADRIYYEIANAEFQSNPHSDAIRGDRLCALGHLLQDSTALSIYNENSEVMDNICDAVFNGMKIEEGEEASWGLVLDHEFLQDSILPFYAGEYSDYLWLTDTAYTWGDLGYISWRIIGINLISYENYLVKYPNAELEVTLLNREIAKMFSAYLAGSDYSAINSGKNGLANEEMIESYRNYISQSNSNERKEIIEGLLALYEKNDLEVNAEVIDYIETYSGTPYLKQ